MDASPPTPSVLVVGEALVDIVHRTDGTVEEHVGGSPLNVAVGLVRLGHAAELGAWIGHDSHGRMVRHRLAEDGVPLVPGSEQAHRTPTAVAHLDATGAARYEFDIAWEVPYALDADGRHLHTGSLAALLQPGGSVLRETAFAHSTGGTFSYDPNARPQLMGDPADARSDVEQFVGLADVVKASDEDVAWLYGAEAALEEVARLWAQLGPSLVVITRGADGALVHLATAKEERTEVLPGHPVEVVDTVGAGDSFMAGLLSGLLDARMLGGVDARERLRAATWEAVSPALDRAVECAAVTVGRAGANPPTRDELRSVTS